MGSTPIISTVVTLPMELDCVLVWVTHQRDVTSEDIFWRSNNRLVSPTNDSQQVWSAQCAWIISARLKWDKTVWVPFSPPAYLSFDAKVSKVKEKMGDGGGTWNTFCECAVRRNCRRGKVSLKKWGEAWNPKPCDLVLVCKVFSRLGPPVIAALYRNFRRHFFAVSFEGFCG